MKTKKCIICEKEYSIVANSWRRPFKSKRSIKTLTCSKNCSRVYLRVRKHLEKLLLKKEMSR